MEFENQYLKYDEYKELGGNLESMPFNLLEYKSRKKIDERTFGRIKELDENNIPQEVKLCVYELINIFDEDENPVLACDGVGNYNPTKRSAEEIERVKISIINQYLSELYINGVRAMYCGVEK